MERFPRLILLQGGGCRSNGEKESTEKPVAESGEVYRADYTHLWRLPPPLPPRRVPYVRVITVGIVMLIALALGAGW